MSITIPGVLVVKSVQGRNGLFSVGDLRTEIGDFRIKDTLLDEYEPGQYTGRFVITSIFPYSYPWRGNISIEVRARLQEILLDEAAVGAPPAGEQPEPDPLDDASDKPGKQSAAPDARPDPAPSQSTTEKGTPVTPDTDDANALFDPDVQALIDEGVMVKLDPTIDRNLFRRQRDALKASGYTFNPASQSWTKE